MHIAIKLAVAITLLMPCACDTSPDDESSRLASVDAIDAQSCSGSMMQALLDLAMTQGGLDQNDEMTEAYDSMLERQEEAVASLVRLDLAVADAVEAGTLADESFGDPLQTIQAAAQAEGEAMADALQTAHSLLDADAREEFYTSLPEPPQTPPGPPTDDEGNPIPPPFIEALHEAVALDESQHQALLETLGPPAPPTPLRPDLESFMLDDFDAHALELAEGIVRITEEVGQRHLGLYRAMVPLLDDPQRDALVKFLREGPEETRPGTPR